MVNTESIKCQTYATGNLWGHKIHEREDHLFYNHWIFEFEISSISQLESLNQSINQSINQLYLALEVNMWQFYQLNYCTSDPLKATYIPYSY